MSGLWQDLAFAWRGIRKHFATALLIVLTLALGIGANSAMFSLVWQVLGAPLPYADGDRLVRVMQQEAGSGLDNVPWSLLTYADFESGNTVFSEVASYFQTENPLYGHGDPHLALTGVVSRQFFDVLGIEPALGRGFIAADDQPGAPAVMLLSREFWLREFGGSPEVIGTALEMNARSYTVIGILPDMPAWPRANEVWLTHADDAVMSHESVVNSRNRMGEINTVIGKLKPGVDLPAASRDAARMAGQLVEAYPDTYGGFGYSMDVRSLREELVGNASVSFLLLLGLAFLVVLIACVNVSHLNLARLLARSQELAVREALGASPRRLRRQLFTESLLFALAGALSGLAIAYPCLALLRDFASGYTPLANELRMDGVVLLFSLVLAGFAGVATGMAVAYDRRDLSAALKEGGSKATASAAAARRSSRLLVLQFALAFVMLSTALLMVVSLVRLNGQDPGYDVERILTGSALLDLTPGIAEDPWEGRDFVMRLLEDVEAMPGVAAAAAAGFPLLQDPGLPLRAVMTEGREDGTPGSGTPIFTAIVSEDYFEVMNIPLQKGRLFDEADDEKADAVLIVNQAFEERYFPEGNAIGQRVSLSSGYKWEPIVGVVGNVHSRELDEQEGPRVYLNFRAGPTQLLNLYIRGEGSLEAVAAAVRQRFQALAPQVPLPVFEPLSELKAQWLGPTRLRAWLVSLFGLLALALTLSGVIGVVSQRVNGRLREIGILMAVGANPRHIVRSFIHEGGKHLLLGMLLGLVLMLTGAGLLQPVLYATQAINPLVYSLTALLLAGSVLLAIWLPASRAAAVEPSVILRAQ